MLDDEILKETVFYMRKRFTKGLYSHRKADFELYLDKLITINNKNHVKEKRNKAEKNY